MTHVRYAWLLLPLLTLGASRIARAGVTQLASSPGLNFKFGGSASFATISADGRFLAFIWGPGGLAGADTNGVKDVYVKDLTSGALEVVSTGPGGVAAGGGGLFGISISDDGRFVAFSSTSKTLVPGDNLTHADVFVHDRALHVTTRVSNGIAGLANGASDAPSLSSDGRFVVFLSNAESLVASDTHPSTDIFMHDRQTGTTVLANTDAAGVATAGPVQINQYPKVSADNGTVDAFVRWQDGFYGLGGGLAGAQGIPELSGDGSLLPGTSVVISVASAAPSAAGAIVVSLEVLATPFFGGSLLASPPLVMVPFVTDATGAFAAAALLPPGSPPLGSKLAYLQAAVADPGAAQGVALSNLLLASLP